MPLRVGECSPVYVNRPRGRWLRSWLRGTAIPFPVVRPAFRIEPGHGPGLTAYERSIGDVQRTPGRQASRGAPATRRRRRRFGLGCPLVMLVMMGVVAYGARHVRIVSPRRRPARRPRVRGHERDVAGDGASSSPDYASSSSRTHEPVLRSDTRPLRVSWKRSRTVPNRPPWPRMLMFCVKLPKPFSSAIDGSNVN